MAYLINRNPSGRIICIHALLKYLYNRFRENSFSLNDMKYDTDAKFNIHQTCSLLIKLPTVNYKICPYLDNPLSRAKCYLTQSLAEDTQKSKSVSDAFNALEGLGLINRTGTSGAISARGKQFIKHEYADEEMCKIIHEAVLSYGPFIGLLSELTRTDGIVDRYDITLGYPVTNETIKNQNKLIRLSTGSENDTIVRTRSTLILWAITSGFLLPKEIDVPTNKNMWHVEVLPYIKSKKWNSKKYIKYFDKYFFSNKYYVGNPLTYNSMTKSTKALRERHQEDIRDLSLKYENIIKNRRFAIVYLLAKCSDDNKKMDITKLSLLLKTAPELFIISMTNFEATLYIETGIAAVAGIPFTHINNVLSPLTKVNIEKLTSGAPKKILDFLDEIYKKITV